MRGFQSIIKSSSIVIMRNFSSARLPRLPVPPLKDTLLKYLRTVKPVVTPEEYKKTEILVKDFGSPGGTGEKLQLLLQERAKNEENWLSEWWLNTAYLEYRMPVVVYSSPGLVFPRQSFKTQVEQLDYVARLLSTAMDYKLTIDDDKIPGEKAGKDFLDMGQYKKVFGTYRVPKRPRDQLLYHPKSRHIVVMHNNHVFKLDLWTQSGQRLNKAQLVAALEDILFKSSISTTPVGILTSDSRDNWSDAYQILSQEPANVSSLEAIKSSLFVLSLDQISNVESYNDQSTSGMQLIHGCGSKSNGGNRWFDKTIQFIVGIDGRVGLTYEHSPAEGQPIASMMDYIVDFIDTDRTEVPAVDYQTPQHLHFVISASLQAAVDMATHNLDRLVDNLEVCAFTFKEFGKEAIKNKKLSPDSFIQIALQFAFYRLHQVPGAQYETAATRKFLHGRTETIRSCSSESIDFARAMLNPSSTSLQRVAALKTAITSHKDYTVQALNGLGVDRHLLGLKLIAEKSGNKVHDIYSDTSYKKSVHIRVSTSQVGSKCDGFMIYGPLVEDGYACCYNPRPNNINFGTSAFRSSPETSAINFKQAIDSSLIEMHHLLETTLTAKL